MGDHAYNYLDYDGGTLVNPATGASNTPFAWNLSNRRGFMWASGEICCSTYNLF